MPRAPRFLVVITAAAAALALASCETPEPVAVAPPPPPPAPPVSVSAHVVERAAAFEAYMDRAAGLTPSFVDGPSVEQSLTIGAAYEPRQLASGVIAYAAVAALQDAGFVEGVRRFARDPAQRAEVAAQLVKDPAYAIQFANSASAAGLVVTALDSQGARVRAAGEQVKQAAYSVQRQSWSKATIPNREQRLANVKALGTSLAPAPSDAIERLRAMALRETPSTLAGGPLNPPYTPVVARGLAIAALSALGYGNDPAWAPHIETLMTESGYTGTNYCFDMSKMNLNQCLAVAKPWYEDVFCLGQHVMIDTGQCVVKAAGAPPPALAPAGTPVSAGTPAAAAGASTGPRGTNP